jgi:glycosyltransferase involved in cell wall biosynthesis
LIGRMKILIHEPDHAGHRMTFVRHLIPAFSGLADELYVSVTAAALNSPEYKTQVEPLKDMFRFVESPPVSHGGLLGFARSKLSTLCGIARKVKADHLIVPFGDGLVQWTGMLGSTICNLRWRGAHAETLMLRGGYGYPGLGPREQRKTMIDTSLSGRSPWQAIHYLDPLSYEYVASLGTGLSRRAHLMPDPIDPWVSVSKAEARRRLGIGVEGRYIGCVGAMTPIKGVDLLIKAFAAARVSSGDRLLLVGKMDNTVRGLVQHDMAELAKRDRIVVIDRYVSDEELSLAVDAMDVVCTPYPNHIGSASIVIRGAAAHRPVLAQAFGWMGMVVPRFGLGWTCEVRDRDTFSGAIQRALANAEYDQFGPSVESFVNFHTVPNFIAHWTRNVRERLGKPMPAEMVSWDDVIRTETNTPAPAPIPFSRTGA